MSIKNIDFIKPFDDDLMEYDYDESMYIPKVEGIRENTYVDLIRDWTTHDNAQSYLQLLARVVYEVILSYKDPKYRDEMLYYLAHSKRARNDLFRIFSDSVWYNRRDGGFMLAYNSGVNLNQGKFVEFGIDRTLSPIAKEMIKNTYFASKVLPYDIKDTQTFDNLSLFLDYLVAEGFLEQEVANTIVELRDVPYFKGFRFIEDVDGKILFTNMNTLRDAIKNKRIYEVSGDW